MCCPRAVARLWPSAVRVRIRSRSTSARPPNTASMSRPVLVPVSAQGSAKDLNRAPASAICLTMANKSKVERANLPVASALSHSDTTGSLSILAKIEAAEAFQTKGFGSALWSAR